MKPDSLEQELNKVEHLPKDEQELKRLQKNTEEAVAELNNLSKDSSPEVVKEKATNVFVAYALLNREQGVDFPIKTARGDFRWEDNDLENISFVAVQEYFKFLSQHTVQESSDVQNQENEEYKEPNVSQAGNDDIGETVKIKFNDGTTHEYIVLPQEKIEGPVKVNTDKIIEKAAHVAEVPSQQMYTEVVQQLSQRPVDTAHEKKDTKLKRIARKIKNNLLGILILSSFEFNTSFTYTQTGEAVTYDNIQVNNLKDWDNVKLWQDDLNKLENVETIVNYFADSDQEYLIVDKKSGMAHMYQGDSLLTSYEVGTGTRVGDDQTVTVVKNGDVVLWNSGNHTTGAGIYNLSTKGFFQESPSFTLMNERGAEVPSALHQTFNYRLKYFGNGNTKDNRMSNGCVNFLPQDIRDLSRRVGSDYKDVKVFILPDNPDNTFTVVDEELRFESRDQNVNRTTCSYKPEETVFKAENINEDGKIFLQTLSDQKERLMKLYPTVSNDTYNTYAKVAYGIFGQESSYGTYGGLRGHFGYYKDIIGTEVGKNVTAGPTQVRLTTIAESVKNEFGINSTRDLFDTKNAAIATMAVLLDCYQNMIPSNRKKDCPELAICAYYNPTLFQNLIRDPNYTDLHHNQYVQNVLSNSSNVQVYIPL